ncbi:hypothetical protein ACFFSH_39785 [Streptomyces filamentosus]|uniref:Lipoprotein n=1 Tax=Streptomyces filamentosus TaxID=67294 RepID=A0A919EMY7_STRFL|nr:hypothetical protein [Streptomyces filamentosus]GHG05145.1 hypothetical protein GCM10017667_39860 [Streptomyces filamentosus]
MSNSKGKAGLFAACAVLATVSLSACGTEGHTSEKSAGVVTQQTPQVNEGEKGAAPQSGRQRSVSARSLPLDEYKMSGADYSKFEQAKWNLTKPCMISLGFKDFVPTPVADLDADMGELNERRYGAYDADQAAKTGYRPAFSTSASSAIAVPRSGIESREWTPQEYLALTGTPMEQTEVDQKTAPRLSTGRSVPDGGCIGQAMDKISGGKPLVDTFVSELNSQSYEDSLKDERVVEVFAKWSTCMRAKGYVYSTPIDANNDRGFTGSVASSKEIDTAIADVSCKVEVDLINVWHAAERDIQNRLIAKHNTRLSPVKQNLAAIRKNASAVASSQ